MNDDRREVGCALPPAFQKPWQEEYEAWKSSMRVTGRGTTADFLRYIIQLGLQQARRER